VFGTILKVQARSLAVLPQLLLLDLKLELLGNKL
jgi:hypothetical protein